MKKFLGILLAAILACCVFAGCEVDDPDKGTGGGGGGGGTDTTTETGSADDWILTAGGKKYTVTTSVPDDELEFYDDAAKTQTSRGIEFTGSGGFWSKADGTAGAGAGGIYSVGVDATDGFSVSFTIDTIGRKDSTHVNGGNWDSWFAFGMMNKAKMFVDKTYNADTFVSEPASGLVGLLIPFVEPSDGHNGSIIMYDCGNNFNYKGDNSIDDVIEGKHTLELRKFSDEWGTSYQLYYDNMKLTSGGEITEARFNSLFPDGKVYLQFYMQNWNARPKPIEAAEDKEYPSSKFTVHSITAGGKTTSFEAKA